MMTSGLQLPFCKNKAEGKRRPGSEKHGTDKYGHGDIEKQVPKHYP